MFDKKVTKKQKSLQDLSGFVSAGRSMKERASPRRDVYFVPRKHSAEPRGVGTLHGLVMVCKSVRGNKPLICEPSLRKRRWHLRSHAEQMTDEYASMAQTNIALLPPRDPSVKRSPVSLRFGHARGLTAHWAVIQYPCAASLPYGFRLRNTKVLLRSR